MVPRASGWARRSCAMLAWRSGRKVSGNTARRPSRPSDERSSAAVNIWNLCLCRTPGSRHSRSDARTRSAVRVALIGPVPPSLGGATPGGVATHQVHLAAGLVMAGVDACLLATNATVAAAAWDAPVADAPFRLYRMARPAWTSHAYRSAVGTSRTARYAFRLGFTRADSSRREILENWLWY